MIDRACISLGEQCNLSCSYCHFRSRSTQKTQTFSTQELITIIDNVSAYCIDKGVEQFKCGIVGSGEPLLEYKKIEELIDFVKESGVNHFSFYTIVNGTIISERMIDFFYKSQDLITVCFSLDGYEELHNIGREKFQKVYQGIQKYEDVFGKKPPVNCTVHKETLRNADAAKQFFTDENFADVTFSKLVDCDDDRLSITDLEFSKFIQSCTGLPFSVRQLKNQDKKKYDCTMYGKLCGVGKTNIFITKLGIYPCGRFYGNKAYNCGPFNTDLHEVEKKMTQMEELSDGECYYDRYVGRRK